MIEAIAEESARTRELTKQQYTDQGDLLLFLFALAGGIGGFSMGYYWHKVFVAGKKDRGPEE